MAALVLLIGLGSAALVYLTAVNDTASVLGYDVVNGELHPISPDDSKTYRHDMEVYGGKANVLMDKFLRWFDGLWHGKSLAFTIAAITIGISSGLFLAARYWPFDLESSG